MERYTDPIDCETCEGQGTAPYLGVDNLALVWRAAKCLSCQGDKLAHEYTCAVCQETFDIADHPPYKSGTTYCCKRCALIEEFEERQQRALGHVGMLDPHAEDPVSNLLRHELRELDVLASDLYKEAEKP